MASENTRMASLRRALKELDDETERVRGMIESDKLPSPVAEKVMEGLVRQRNEIMTELHALERRQRTEVSAWTTAEWCCEAFQGKFESAGERAFAIVVERSSDGYAFVLQHRAVEPDDPGPKEHPRPISILSESRIHFCPWCGRSLTKFYERRIPEMFRPGLTIAEQ